MTGRKKVNSMNRVSSASVESYRGVTVLSNKKSVFLSGVEIHRTIATGSFCVILTYICLELMSEGLSNLS